MATLNISMPDAMRMFVERRALETQHATPTEYIRSLLREDQRKADRERLERALLKGLDSGDAIEVDDLKAYFAGKRRSLLGASEKPQHKSKPASRRAKR